ncbi:MAG: Hsp70 family protein, partial [Myxococcales bacterium]|nr:Hsp70 family protein [Myxococcales bacterium]
MLVLDIGTSACRAALIVDGRPEVAEWPLLGGSVPTVVGVDGIAPLLGEAARRLAITEPRSQIFAAPRLAGLRYELVGVDGERWRQVPVFRGPGGDLHFSLAGEAWPVPRILATLLRAMVGELWREREIVVERTYVAMSPGADDARRRAVEQALQIADLPAATFVASTTAAALAWSTLEREGQAALGLGRLEAALTGPLLELAEIEDEELEDDDEDEDDEEPPAIAEAGQSQPGEGEGQAAAEDGGTEEDEDDDESGPPAEQTVLLVDLGAGSFDAAVVRLEAGNVEVLAARSRTDVGGLDIDERIVAWLLERFAEENEVDLSNDPTVLARMRDVAEKGKRALTDEDSVELRLPYLWADESGPKHLFVSLERAVFERMIREVTEAAAALAQAVVRDAGQDPRELDAVIMVGGCSRVPVIQDRLEALFGRVPDSELGNPALDEDFVVRGLALEAARRSQRRPKQVVVEVAGNDYWLRRITSMDGGEDEDSEARPLFERGVVLPARKTIALEHDPQGADLIFEVLEGDDEQRLPALRLQLGGERSKLELHFELDQSGRLDARVDELVRGKRAWLRRSQRV